MSMRQFIIEPKSECAYLYSDTTMRIRLRTSKR